MLKYLIPVGFVLLSCEKDESDIVGSWDEAQHLVNGDNFTEPSRQVTFLDDNTYHTTGFTYPWHCEPGAASADNGTWNYDGNTKIITLTSTKPQETHSHNVVAVEITSFVKDQMVFEFTSPSCSSQNVTITLQR